MLAYSGSLSSLAVLLRCSWGSTTFSVCIPASSRVVICDFVTDKHESEIASTVFIDYSSEEITVSCANICSYVHAQKFSTAILVGTRQPCSQHTFHSKPQLSMSWWRGRKTVMSAQNLKPSASLLDISVWTGLRRYHSLTYANSVAKNRMVHSPVVKRSGLHFCN